MKFQLQFKKIPVTPSSAYPVDSSATMAYPIISTAKSVQAPAKSPASSKADSAGKI